MLKYVIYFATVLAIFYPLPKQNFACAFHEAIPEITSDQFIESYYYPLPLDESIDINEYLADENYLYVIHTAKFIYIETLLQDIAGIYALDGNDVRSITQDTNNLNIVIITFHDGEVLEINSLLQNDYLLNALYLDETSEKGYSIKEEYLFLYNDNLNAPVPTDKNTVEGPEKKINSAAITFVILLCLIPVIIVIHTKRQEEKNANKH